MNIGGKKMEDRIKSLLNDVDKEFYKLDPCMQAKFALEQVSIWQQKFNESKDKAIKENFVDATRECKRINQSPEIF